MPRIIKRYSNRKLYDTQESCYITLKSIGELVRAGEEIQIIDNATGEDLSRKTLAQVLLEEEKDRKNVLPVTMLREMIQRGGEGVVEAVKRGVQAGTEAFTHAEEEMERHVKRLAERGVVSQEEARRIFGDFASRFERGYEQIEKLIDQRIEDGLRSLSIPTSGDLRRLESKIDGLEKTLDSLAEKVESERGANG